MLTPEDIKTIVNSGEGYNAEFKVRFPSKLKELTEEVCAFANAAGGILLVGVDDDNHIRGVTIDNAKRSAIQNSLNEINPHLPTTFYKVMVDEKEIWVIEVSSGTQKPYMLSGAIYVRQGPNTQKITSVEGMRAFFQQSDRIYFDEGLCPDFDIANDLDTAYFEEFRAASKLSGAVKAKQIIANLKLTNTKGVFKNGGVLFFAKAPEAFFEKAVIRCVAFKGITKTQIIDDKVYGGPLMHQYEQAMHWLNSKLDVRYVIEGSGPRQELWEIPEIAFKEALINALAHRDYYDKGARITIELFDDRVEVSNPGGLVGAIDPAEFGFKSHSRNPLIFGLFERIQMVEQIGSGISRIRDAMEKASLPSPIFKTEGMFTLVLKRPNHPKQGSATENTRVENENTRVENEDTRVEKINLRVENENTRVETKPTRDKIIELIKEDKTITTPELADKLGITVKGVEYHLDRLKKDNIIRHVGPTKAGAWEILKEVE
ncbi:AlbA family DNA-binding domain-containing protein [Olivibacter sitiensis]|uniref:AlbA family DNA-binding domain-containing protein n=1 Tax=Olivibacter sitiensis TaxID=376470 RepID=UPI00040B4788|nr:helix-turn-helix domain-containing protein [Olivibacter sitiensis]